MQLAWINKSVYPKEGNIPNGQPITRDPETGILGFGNGQKDRMYLGVKANQR